MVTVEKYLSRQVFKFFGIILLLVVGIYLIVDFFERIDDFMKADVAVDLGMTYLLYKIPFIIVEVMPVVVMLAIIIAVGLMSKNNEILALKSAGISVYALFRPVFLTGIAFAMLLFFFAESIVPITMGEANQIMMTDIKKKKFVTSVDKDIWIKGSGAITHINYYHPGNKTIFGLVHNFFDKDFNLVRRIDVEKAIYTKGQWRLEDVVEQVLVPESNTFRSAFHASLMEPLELLPDDLKKIARKSEEMGVRDIIEYIRQVESEGYSTHSLWVDLHIKLAYPFACLIMCLIGYGVAINPRLKEGLPYGILIGLGVIFLYWISYSFGVSLGYGEMLPAFISVWAADIVFFCIGVLILLNAE